MSDMNRSNIITVDLTRPLQRESFCTLLATGDNNANRFGAYVLNKGKPVDLSGCAVTGYFIRPDASTIVCNGTVEENTAYVVLPQACYTEQGMFSLAVKVSGNGITHTLRIIDGHIRTTQTGTLIDPGSVVPSLDDIFAQIAAMEAVTAEAETATAEAEQATTAAIAATHEIRTTSAPAIVPTATGKTVTISDSANRPFSGLTLYGKTTQDGTPTPDAPVELVSVGDGGSVTVKACGKNLFNYEAWKSTHIFNGSAVYEDYGVTLTASANDCYTSPYSVNARIYVREGMKVTMSWEEPNNVSGQVMLFPNGGSTGLVQVDNRYTKQLSYTVPVDVHFVVPRFGVTTAGDVAYYKNIQVVVGTTATTFEPYKSGGSMTVSTPNGLPGIPVSSGGNYTDSEGQQWLCDEIDFGRGVYVKRIRQTVIGADATLNLYGTDGVDVRVGGRMCGNVLCNIAEYARAGDLFGGRAYGVSENFAYDQIVFRLEGYTTVEDYSALFAEKEASGNPVTVFHALATPIETALSAEELAAFAALTSQYPNTTVINDAGAGMAVQYIADTKNYIDRKIAAIAAATV